jgi:hypothetical protein
MRLSVKIAAVALLLFAITAASAQPRGTSRQSSEIAQAANVRGVSSLSDVAAELVSAATVTLPPEDKPKTHWPWWLRILAVIGVFIFIRVVAGSVRNKPTGPPPS